MIYLRKQNANKKELEQTKQCIDLLERRFIESISNPSDVPQSSKKNRKQAPASHSQARTGTTVSGQSQPTGLEAAAAPRHSLAGGSSVAHLLPTPSQSTTGTIPHPFLSVANGHGVWRLDGLEHHAEQTIYSNILAQRLSTNPFAGLCRLPTEGSALSAVLNNELRLQLLRGTASLAHPGSNVPISAAATSRQEWLAQTVASASSAQQRLESLISGPSWKSEHNQGGAVPASSNNKRKAEGNEHESKLFKRGKPKEG